MPGSAVLSAKGLHLAYGKIVALAGADIDVNEGEIVALTGRSGSGKTSLLYCLAGIVRALSGSAMYRGQELRALDDAALSRLRREEFGFVFQFGELVPELTIGENVALPLRLNGVSRKQAQITAAEMLERLEIAPEGDRRPGEVSGGQAQRAAVARALVHRPRVVFADEPTGALDSENRTAVLQELVGLARDAGAAVVLVTHEADVAEIADRLLRVVDGKVRDGASQAGIP